VRLLAVPFPAMRTALQNGQVDAIWTPEPFLSLAINVDGARTVMAPGPVLGDFFPIGGYGALDSWTRRNPGLARRFRTAINQALAYAQSHPNEIRALLPAAQRDVRLPIWTTLVDRQKVAQLARWTKQYGVIETLPNLAALIPAAIPGGKTLQGAVGNRFILLRQDGRAVTRLAAGQYTFVVTDSSRTQNFRLRGPGVNRQTSVRGVGRATWQVRLRRGTYVFSSSNRASLKRTFVVRLARRGEGAPGRPPRYGAKWAVGAITTSSSSGVRREASVGSTSSKAASSSSWVSIRRASQPKARATAASSRSPKPGHGASAPCRSARRSMIA
jgi:hypothetical protein